MEAVRPDDHIRLAELIAALRRDGLQWPHRDGLKWPHLALVDVVS